MTKVNEIKQMAQSHSCYKMLKTAFGQSKSTVRDIKQLSGKRYG